MQKSDDFFIISLFQFPSASRHFGRPPQTIIQPVLPAGHSSHRGKYHPCHRTQAFRTVSSVRPAKQAYMTSTHILPDFGRLVNQKSYAFQHLFYHLSLTFRQRMAFNTASTITPTSAKIASHMPAYPRAPRIRQIALTARANTIFS